MIFAPRIEGAVPIRAPSAQFAAAFRERVAAGLLFGAPHPRSSYRVVESRSDVLRVSAADTSTAIHVGLNELEIRFDEASSVRFQVRYWRWASYVLGLGAALGLVGIVLLLTLDVRTYIADHATARLPGLSLDQNVGVAWAMALFWGFAWPWCLIALHKRPLRRLAERLIGEVAARAAGARS